MQLSVCSHATISDEVVVTREEREIELDLEIPTSNHWIPKAQSTVNIIRYLRRYPGVRWLDKM